MEFLGDSVLDVILAVHVWAEPECPACAKREAAAAASDLHLAEAARRAGLGEWLEWRASDDRIADLVETCVAACWLSGRWQQAARFAAHVVHPVGDQTVRALALGGAHLEAGRVARRAGSALLELAAGDGVVRAFPDADEGELSTRRATIHRATTIAVVAKERGLAHRGDPETVLSAVEDQVAAVLAAEGADAALAVARHFVPVVAR
jgi:dsRNA-specific ribonuclease